MSIRVAITAVIGHAGIGISQNRRSVWDGVDTANQFPVGKEALPQSEVTKGIRIERVKPERKE
jgi:hypothetical protein